MTRGTLFYYETDSKVWSSTEFNGDMYHGTPENPQGRGDEVIKLMQGLKSVDDFDKVLAKINKHYGYEEGNDGYSIGKTAIKKDIKSIIEWIDTERQDLKGSDMDPRTWEKAPSFRDIRTWQYWGIPNLSDYSYIYNNSGKNLILTTRNDGEKMIVPDGCCGVLCYGEKDCLCKDGKIIDGMGNYEASSKLESMDKKQFYDYITENFTLDGTSRNLILNILDYAEHAADNETDGQAILLELLDGIGLTDEEIKQAKF